MHSRTVGFNGIDASVPPENISIVTDHVEILNNPDGIYLKEYKFFREIFRTLTDNTKLCLNRKTFRRTPCIILEPYANWCKENKCLWLHEYLALLDVIVMRNRARMRYI